jgi:hypothetical protein
MKVLLFSIIWVSGIIVCQLIGTWLMIVYLILSASVSIVYND